MTTALTYDNAIKKVTLVKQCLGEINKYKFMIMETLDSIQKDYTVSPITAEEQYGYNDFKDLCKYEFNCHYKYAEQLIAIHNFIKEHGIHVFQGIDDVQKINIIRKASVYDDDIDDWVVKAKALTREDLDKEYKSLKKGTHKDPIQADKKPDKQVTDDLRNYLKDLEGMSASYIPRESVVKKIKSILA